MSRLPTFLIIGAQKSGTISLYEYLRQHPQVYMSPVKEPQFFTYEGERPPSAFVITEWSDYQALFAQAREDHIALGEASTSYLHALHAPERITRYLPNVRLVAILRNPVERAFSNWIHNVENGRERLEFRDALNVEEERMRQGVGYAFYYLYKGFYYQHLCRYLALLPRDHLRVYLFDDLCSDPVRVIQDIYGFIGVDPDFQPRIERHNVSGIPKGLPGRIFSRVRKSTWVQKKGKELVPERVRAWVRKRLIWRPSLPQDVRYALIELYREDILQLESLLGRDLSAWLK